MWPLSLLWSSVYSTHLKKCGYCHLVGTKVVGMVSTNIMSTHVSWPLTDWLQQSGCCWLAGPVIITVIIITRINLSSNVEFWHFNHRTSRRDPWFATCVPVACSVRCLSVFALCFWRAWRVRNELHTHTKKTKG